MSYLKANTKYSFYILYGIHYDSVSKLNYRTFGVKVIKVFSPEFKNLCSEIEDIELQLQKDLDDFEAFQAADISCLIYSANPESVSKFFDFIRLIFPSKINLWLSFDTHYEIYTGVKQRHHSSGQSIWIEIYKLHSNLDDGDIFYISHSQIKTINSLMKEYDRLSKNKSYINFINFFRNAYHEENEAFKFLLFFMLVESLVVDDDKTGVVYKIRRLCAVLIGDNIEQSELIFKKIGKAYDIRSALVHSGKNKLPNTRFLPFLHSVVCELGLTILMGELETNMIFQLATKLGYGTKHSLIKTKNLSKQGCITQNRINFLLDLQKSK